MSSIYISLVIINEETYDGVRFSSDESTIISLLSQYQDMIRNDYDCLIVSDLKGFIEYQNLVVCHSVEDLLKTLTSKGIKVSTEV